MIESGRVPREGRIFATTVKLSERVSEKVRIGEYREKVESGRETGKDRINVRNEKW